MRRPLFVLLAPILLLTLQLVLAPTALAFDEEPVPPSPSTESHDFYISIPQGLNADYATMAHNIADGLLNGQLSVEEYAQFMEENPDLKEKVAPWIELLVGVKPDGTIQVRDLALNVALTAVPMGKLAQLGKGPAVAMVDRVGGTWVLRKVGEIPRIGLFVRFFPEEIFIREGSFAVRRGIGVIEYGGLNKIGGASQVRATITKDLLDTGTKASKDPPGWVIGGTNQERGHLVANSLGGTGDDIRNLVTLTPEANRQMWWKAEAKVRARVEAGETVEYVVTPRYGSVGSKPTEVHIHAEGDNGFYLDVLILNE